MLRNRVLLCVTTRDNLLPWIDLLILEELAMKCPKCGYTSFPYLESCSKCGRGLAEERTAFGLYALRPDPPDLVMAYQAAPLDVDGITSTPALSSLFGDLSHLDEIELELAEAEDPPSAAEVGREQIGGAVDLAPTSPIDPAREVQRVEPETEPANPQEGVLPPAFDLGELGGLSFALESTADPEAPPLESAQPPTPSPDAEQVYDLDLEEDIDGLTLGSEMDDSRADERDEGTVEYILEVEDELDLEIDDLTLEEGEESGEEDDDHR
jgi:hypothetical protein